MKQLKTLTRYLRLTVVSGTLLLSLGAQHVSARELTRAELRGLGIQFIDVVADGALTSVSGPAAGSGACYELATPQINDQAALGKAIDDYISSKAPESPFIGLGADIVQGSVKQGVNPLFVVGNLRMESAFGTTGTSGSKFDLAVQLHDHFNAFGRRGTERTGFPQRLAENTFRRDAKGNIIYWYNYPSWKDSVNSPAASPDNTTDQPSVMRKVYLDDGLLTIGQYLARYAPASDGNDESVYGKVLKDVIGSIATLAGSALGCTDNATTVQPQTQQPASTNPTPSQTSQPGGAR